MERRVHKIKSKEGISSSRVLLPLHQSIYSQYYQSSVLQQTAFGYDVASSDYYQVDEYFEL